MGIRGFLFATAIAAVALMGCDDSGGSSDPVTDAGAGGTGGGSGGGAGGGAGGATGGGEGGGTGGGEGGGTGGGEGGGTGGGAAGAGGGAGGAGGGAGGAGGDGLPPLDGDAPEKGFVAVAEVGDAAHVIWWGADALWVRELAADGTWAAERMQFTGVADPVSDVQALTVGQVPFVVVTDAGTGEASVLQADLPEEDPVALGIEGPTHVAQLGRGLLVVGRSGDVVAWRVVAEDLAIDAPESGLQIRDTTGAATGLETGALLRFPDVGQCLSLAADGTPRATLACRLGPGTLHSDGRLPILSYVEPSAGRDLIWSQPALAPNQFDRFAVGQIRDEVDAFRFAPVGQARAFLVERLGNPEDVPDAGRLSLRIATAEGLVCATEHWDEWPHDTARAVVARGEAGHLVTFDGANPTIVALDMDPDCGNFGFELDEGCSPAAEVCDGEDQDCDGIADNGICCHDDRDDVSIALAREHDNDGQIVIDPEMVRPDFRLFERDQNRHKFVLEVAPGQFEFFNFGFVADRIDYFGLQSIATTFDEFPRYTGVGGHNLLLGTVTPDGGEPAVWTAWSSNLRVDGEPPLRDAGPLEACGMTRVFASEQLRDSPVESAAAVVVCAAGIVTQQDALGDGDDSEATLLFNPDGTAEADRFDVRWGTIARIGDGGANDPGVRQVLVGGLRGGEWAIELYTVSPAGISLIDLPPGLASLGDPAQFPNEDMAAPIWQDPTVTSYLQIIEDENRARVLRFDIDDSPFWQEIVFSETPDRVEFAAGLRQVVASKAVGDDMHFWVVDVRAAEGKEALNLWTAGPSYVKTGGALQWRFTPGRWTPGLVMMEGGADQSDDENTGFSLSAVDLRCRAP